MARAARLGIAARLVTPLRPAHLHGALLEAFGLATEVARAVPTSPLSRATDDPRPLRILLADDNVVNQKVVLLMLQRQGYQADVAGNGREVLEALERQDYDVVLLDVQMPEIDGLETARRIRARWDPGPRLIALTANALRGDREACLAAGMNDYLSKPLAPTELASALSRAWSAENPGRLGAKTEARSEPGGEGQGAPPADDPVVLAREPLEQLRQMEDEENRDFVWGLVQDFIREVPMRLASMEEARAGGDRVTLERLAHSLKGSAGMIGGLRFAARCSVVERAAQDGTGPLAPGMLADVRREFEALRAELILAVPAPPGASGTSP